VHFFLRLTLQFFVQAHSWKNYLWKSWILSVTTEWRRILLTPSGKNSEIVVYGDMVIWWYGDMVYGDMVYGDMVYGDMVIWWYGVWWYGVWW
jgi:hypothetical protein